MGPAEGGHDVAALHALGSRPHPLVGTRDVVDQLARPQQSAEDLVHSGELGQFAGAGCPQRLVGEDQSLLDAIGHDKQPTKICQRQELDVGIAEPASDRDRLAEQGLAHVRVRWGTGALVVRRSGGVLALEVQRLGKAFERLARFDLGEGELERTASARGVAARRAAKPSSIRGELTTG
jgi:hypothetical protein